MQVVSQKAIKDYLDDARSIISTQGYVVQGVNASGDDPSYMYTIGRGQQSLPELICFGTVNLTKVIDEIAGLKDPPMDQPMQVASFSSLNPATVEKYQIRYILKEYPIKAAQKVALGAFNKNLIYKDPTKFILVVLADHNNLLPGEPGYEPPTFSIPGVTMENTEKKDITPVPIEVILEPVPEEPLEPDVLSDEEEDDLPAGDPDDPLPPVGEDEDPSPLED